MSRSKPLGLVLIGVMALAFGVVSMVLGVALASGNALIFDIAQPAWVLLVGAVAELLVAYFAIRVGLALLRGPAMGRRALELTLWVGIPIVWLAVAVVDLLLTEGADDVEVWPVVAPVGALLSVVLIGEALYMRSQAARTYFDDTG